MEEKTRIRLLNEATINRIAAGEVVENAASVVKELVENAIDAEASSIHVETLGGGRKCITVKDDGIGMNKEDLFLCIERHATSKISEVDDLDHLKTLGFRGEAVAAIASVSKMTIESARRGKEEGVKLSLEGEKILSVQNLARKAGTKVEVASLFFNVPARKKFLKTLSAETFDMREVLIKATLGYPHLEFSWTHEGKLEFSVPAAIAFQEKIALLLGKEFAESLTPIDKSEGQLRLFGAIGSSHTARANRKGQYLFINQRPIFSSFISKCVEEAYGTRLTNHRFPLFVLHLNLPPSTLDVNVHPQKKEVRLQEEDKVKDLIVRSIRENLEKGHVPVVHSKVFFPAPKTLFLSSPPVESPPKEKDPELELKFPKKERLFLPVMGGYIVCQENEGELLLIDSVRALFRIFYEKKQAGPVSSQTLLFPSTLEVSQEGVSLIEENLSFLQTLGLHLRFFGGTTFMVEAIPAKLDESEVKLLLESLLEDLPLKDPLEKEKKTMLGLCRFLKRKPLDLSSSKQLVEDLFNCKVTKECPLGKPIFKILTAKDFSKWF